MKANRIFRKHKKRVMVVLTVAFLCVVGLLVYANRKIPHDTCAYLCNNVNDVPCQKVALVLGAAAKLKSGQPNPYFSKRIRAAQELYAAGKVRAFMLSGDNSREYYNEPQDMKDALAAVGVPDSIIYLDYAGFRTLDSVVRMKEVFGQDSFIIVSQRFHNERAVFLAQHYGLTAYGYNAPDVTIGQFALKTTVREKLARVKVFIDMLTGKDPKFLGEPVIINA
jgi:SanA protein